MPFIIIISIWILLVFLAAYISNTYSHAYTAFLQRKNKWINWVNILVCDIITYGGRSEKMLLRNLVADDLLVSYSSPTSCALQPINHIYSYMILKKKWICIYASQNCLNPNVKKKKLKLIWLKYTYWNYVVCTITTEMFRMIYIAIAQIVEKSVRIIDANNKRKLKLVTQFD